MVYVLVPKSDTHLYSYVCVCVCVRSLISQTKYL